MTYKNKLAVKKTARAAARGVWGIVLGVLKAIGVMLLIFITTGAIFACIFLVYIKTNLASTDLGVTIEEYQLNETSIIYYYDSDTKTWKESASIMSDEGYMYWVPYSDIPDLMEKALVSIEDKRFYKHHGVDWSRTASAFLHMFLGDSTFGGSTITQQLRKNVTGESDATVRRKLTEIFAALEMERQYDKWQIIEWYLNFVNFGHGNSKGIGDAARYYFDKDVKDLSLAEMCSIIGITNNPSKYNPYYHPENNKKRQEVILYEMLRQGYIDRQTYEEAKAEELHFVYASTGGDTGQVYSWFDEAVRQDVAEFLAQERGISVDGAKRLLATGGFKIYSTMDPKIQACVDEVYSSYDFINSLGATGPSGSKAQQFQSAIVISDPYTGNIVAMAGRVGPKDANLLYNLATEARRPPGSSFQPIAVYGPAMDYGLITPDTKFDDSRDVVLVNKGDNWLPKNDGNTYHGIETIRDAIVGSHNVVSAQVLDQLSPAASYDFLTNKLHMELDPADCDYAPLCLGQLTYGITVREMANAFGIFPNSGMYIESRTFTQIYDSDWNLVYENEPDAEAVISPVTAYWMTDILHDAAVHGTGSESNLGEMPTAGKTGTSGDKKDRWFVGFTPYYTAAVWTGYEMPVSITVSGNPASKIWKEVMSKVHENLPVKDFPVPTSTYQVPVPGIEAVDYFIRGMALDELGGITTLYEEKAGSGVVGREKTVTAKDVEGYILQGENTAKLILTVEPEDNVVEFIYKAKNPDPLYPSYPSDPTDASDPSGPFWPTGPSDPGGSTEPEPSSEPTDTATVPDDTTAPTDDTQPEDTGGRHVT